MPKFLQCHRQPRAPRKRSVSSVNDHPAIVDIFRKFYENGPCIQTISFRVTMLEHSQKKRKDGLETRAKRAVLLAYVKNHAILQPILLYRASKYKQTKRPGY